MKMDAAGLRCCSESRISEYLVTQVRVFTGESLRREIDLGPFKGGGVLVVSGDEGVDLLDELLHGAEAGALAERILNQISI